jgi:hypothetical protein
LLGLVLAVAVVVGGRRAVVGAAGSGAPAAVVRPVHDDGDHQGQHARDGEAEERDPPPLVVRHRRTIVPTHGCVPPSRAT